MARAIVASIAALVICAAAAADDAEVIATLNASGVQELNMTATSYKFTPDRIVVQVNTPVLLHVKKDSWIPHDFTLDDPASGLSIKQNLSKSTTIEFTPTKTGEFEFYCSKKPPFLKSHRDRGMHGILVVR